MGAHRHRRQAQARRPALGPPGEARERVRRQRAAVPGHQQAGFGDAESQVAAPDLGQLASQPVTVQPQQRVHPRGHNQAQPRSRIPQDEIKSIQHRGAGQQMKVVEDERHRRVLGSQRRRKPHQERMIGRPPPRGGRQRFGYGNAGPAQGRDGIGPEDPRPVVVTVQADPGHNPWFRRRPQRQGHRFARARRAGHDSQRARPGTLGDQLGDPRARHRPAGHTRRGDLSGQDRITGRNGRLPGTGTRLPSNMDRHQDLPAPSPASHLMLARH